MFSVDSIQGGREQVLNRKSITVPCLVLSLALLLSSARLAAAHDYWIEASNFWLQPGDRVLLYLRVGEYLTGQPAAFSLGRVIRFHIDNVTRRFEVLPLQRDPAGMARLQDRGLQVVSFENVPTYLELPGERFSSYLQAEGLEGILEARRQAGASDQPGKEAYSRCAKALLWVGDGPPAEGGVAFHNKPVGLTLELLPETNPYRLRAPASLTVQLLYEGQPVPGASVMALNKSAPNEVQRVQSGPDGRADFALRRGGLWLVKAVHMVPAAVTAPEDWRSYWASLTFDLPTGP